MKKLIKLHKIGKDCVDIEGSLESWIDPHVIVSILPNKKQGSVITLQQGNFFKVEENPGEVMNIITNAHKIDDVPTS